MDKAEQTMLENLKKITGKTLEQWIDVVKYQNLEKHAQILSFLKNEHGFTHGFANLVALKTLATDAGSFGNKEELIEKQYKGKEHFKPIYEKILADVLEFGEDVVVAPKNANVSLRRKKQFALLFPATKNRFEVGINLKGHPAKGKLEAIETSNAMCSHKINLSGVEDVDQEVMEWIRLAYEQAG